MWKGAGPAIGRPRLAMNVCPDDVADEALAGGQDEDEHHEDADGYPSHICPEPPGLDEMGPAGEDLGAAVHLMHGEDGTLGSSPQLLRSLIVLTAKFETVVEETCASSWLDVASTMAEMVPLDSL
ncbi:hypothetical protein NDU88_002657 [Pleurodeles waltl]|uniref:Uncharacterized protein n=1 Tax=Pleurodeles waltl TaxID=8319 RepID=A0AAV7SDC8_PLEWA|nr:hypothetical protein NDU88_002657 [Pleurodeles waltl]